jgi:hypothetical protein
VADAKSIAGIERKLSHVLEAGMRRALVIEWLEGLDGETADAAVRAVVAALGPRRAEQVELLRPILVDLLGEDGGADGLSYDLRSQLYASAAAAGDDDVMRLLRSASPREVARDPTRLLSRELAEIPLGRRRSLAKESPSAALLEQLARDPDPTVIEHLLQNARTTEADVLRMAALRPVAASTLAAIADARRFSVCPRIRMALARNPYCPTEIAVRLVAALPLGHVREMRNDPDLHPETRAQVAAMLSRSGA